MMDSEVGHKGEEDERNIEDENMSAEHQQEVEDSGDEMERDSSPDKEMETGTSAERHEEDSTVLAHRRAKGGPQSNRPPKIKMSTTPTGICFHPEEDLLAVSTFNSEISFFAYSNKENELKRSVKYESYCRGMKFANDGTKLFACMNDKKLVVYDSSQLQVERSIAEATGGYPSSLFVIDENVIAIGDDDGIVNFWDKRSEARAMTFEVASDAVTSMTCDPDLRILVTTSSDGSVATVKIRGSKVNSKSNTYPYALNSAGLVKQNTKLAVGDSDGRLIIFNWGEFYSHSDICTSDGTGINRVVPITEHIVLTGCDDGTIKATYLFPHEPIGEVGDHNRTPVEEMDVNNDGHLIATTSIDKEVNFWNVEYLADYTPCKKGKHNKKKESKRHLPSSNGQNPSNFFDDLVD